MKTFKALCCQTASEWNAWTSWSSCDQTCGGGRKQRSRTCQDDIQNEDGDVVPCNGQGEFESARNGTSKIRQNNNLNI